MSVLDHYSQFFKEWRAANGPKPTISEINAVHNTGQCRIGAKDTFAVAMALGVTQLQIRNVLGEEHRNKIMELVNNGTAIRIAMPQREARTVYKIVFVKHKQPPIVNAKPANMQPQVHVAV
jgi:hypothetical protein